jgi:hypothetical protein
MTTPKQLLEELLATGMRATHISEGANIDDTTISRILSGKQADMYSIPMLRLMDFHKKTMRRSAGGKLKAEKKVSVKWVLNPAKE